MPRVAVLLLLLLGALLAYSRAFSSRFVYDDDSFVVLNPAIRSLEHPFRFFTDPRTLAGDTDLARDNYRPLTSLSFALNYAVSGLEPRSYHAVNVALHLANGLLVFWLAYLLAGLALPGRRLAFASLAAAVFLLHPVQTESVTWVSQRSGLLSLLFMLGAWHAYLLGRGGSRAWRYAGLVLFACSLLCKEEAVVLPVLLVLQDWCFGSSVPWRRRAASYVPYFGAVVALILAKRLLIGQLAQTDYWADGFLLTVLSTFKGWMVYLKLLFWPWPLSIEYVLPPSASVFEPATLAAVLVLAGLTFLAWKLRKSRPLTSFGILVFLFGLGPVSNIIPIRTIINERFLYLPVLGFAIVAADLIAGWAYDEAGAEGRPFVWSAAACWLVALGFLTARRNLDWKNADTLLHATVAVCPDSARVHYGLGRVYAEQERWADAEAEFHKALALDPSYYEAINDLGRLAQKHGDLATAVVDYKKAIELKPDWGDAHYNLGSAYEESKDFDLAVAELMQADQLKPGDAPIENNLAVAYSGQGDMGNAIATLQRLLAVHPDDPKAAHNLALFEGLAQKPAASQAAAPAAPPAPQPSELEAVAKEFPALKSKWDRAANLEYDEQPDAIQPKVGYRGSSQSLASLKPEEKAALDALAAREHAADALEITFSPRAGTMTLNQGPVHLSQSLLGARPVEAQVQDGLVAYRGAYPHADVFFIADAASVEQFIYMKTPKAPTRYDMEVTVRGSLRQEGDMVAFYDESGARKFQLSAPIVVDATGRQATGRMEVAPEAPAGELRDAPNSQSGAAAPNKFILSWIFNTKGMTFPLLVD